MSLDKLKNLEFPVPMKNEKIDTDYIEKIVKNSYGFEEIEGYL